MPSAIGRHEVRRLVEEEGAQVVEVLPQLEYDWAHIAGAANIPLKELDESAVVALDKGRPLVVYCNDMQ